MNEVKYLVDSNIIIYHLNKNQIAEDFLIRNIDRCYISRLTYIEVLSFDFDSEEAFNKAKELLNIFKIFDTDEEIAIQCLRNRKLKKIRLPDNLIVSTAQTKNCTLVTRNVKDFNGLDVKILNPFDVI